ncbi:MAG: RtcB family protein [Planctomycetes bacterium]|nr:RtcB family protein [Planctomycetota bacterium]
MKVPLNTWLVDPLDAEVAKAIDRVRRADDVQQVAVMPDVHLAKQVCVGLVVATSRLIYPQAVGGDIGCGMATLALDAGVDLIEDPLQAAKVLESFATRIPILKQARPEASLPIAGTLSQARLDRLAQREGRFQLGTLGRGNHFLELQGDDEGRLWICVHSGSRAMGRAIMTHYLGASTSKLVALDAESQEGQDYLRDHDWALAYAKLNRRRILEAAVESLDEIFGVTVQPESHLECHHNQVRRETHGGQDYWVHRKGAMSARDGEAGIIPGSMGSASFQVEGRGCAEALCSSSHGAGRVGSRHAARSRITVRDLYREMQGVWFDHRRGHQLCDEAPSAYRDISKVMRAQRALTRITRTLHPRLSYKG